MTIYVGNLPFSATEDEVNDLFSQFGTVQSVKLITDRETGKPRGFGFVEMDKGDAEEAIDALNGQDFGGRKLQVNEAREKKGGREGNGGGGFRSQSRGEYRGEYRGGGGGRDRY